MLGLGWGVVIDLRAVVRLQGVVHRLAKKASVSTKYEALNNPSDQVVADKCKAASRRTVPGVFSSDASLLEAPFQQNRGSRFSPPSEQGLFYGSRSRKGCLIEGAYYALFFYEGSEYFASGKTIKFSKILFQVKIDSENCLKLQEQGSDTLQARLRDPSDYGFTQAVGTQMRVAEITCFEYLSARSSRPIVQFGAFISDVFCSSPLNQVNITIKIKQANVEIHCHDDNRIWKFTRQQYEVNGQLPPPACVEGRACL